MAAEWVPPPTDEAHILDDNDDNTNSSGRPSAAAATYVVHLPKDQIYRIPPPENAAIAHSRRPSNHPADSSNNRTSHRCPSRRQCCCCTFLIITIVILILTLTLTLSILVSASLEPPDLPSFSVQRLTGAGSSRDGYEVRLGTENPNARVDFLFDSGASAAVVVLLLNNNDNNNNNNNSTSSSSNVSEVAVGKFLEFRLGRGSAAEVKITMRGGGGVKGASSGRKGRVEIKNVAARTEVWSWNTGTIVFDVVCDVKVDSLLTPNNRGARVLSQACRSTRRD